MEYLRRTPGRAPYVGVRGCTSHQSNTHSTESREVLYPWHPWFGRAVWIFLTRVNHGRMVAHCGLEPRHESRGVEVPLGRGSVDFPELIGALEEHGYRGYFTIEREEADDPEFEIGQAVKFLKNL